ncbi:hypothetical protein ACF07V_12600 [Streptomyces sp. NPDC015661]|uniref:hypothetical protein n=1 Tax=Streptomyces sp. NPDC015661 TaxID=3364961 RepID=UPI0037020685
MKTAFPYRILAGEVTLAADEVRVDNIPLSLNLVSDKERVIALHAIRRDWDEIRVKVVVTADPEELGSGVWTSPRCLVFARNRATNVRHSFPLRYEGEGRWTGEVELHRGDHVGRTELGAIVVAEVGGIEGRLIGRTEDNWSADFEAKQPKRQRSIKMLWREFTEDPFLRDFRDDPWVLDAEAGEPILYLNASLEGFRPLLDGGPGAERKLVREVMASQIASEAWTALFNTALYAAGTDDDELQWPGGWQEEVLRRMLPDFFPGVSPDEALAELVDRRSRGENGSDLHARLMHSSSIHSKKQKTVAGTVRALARLADGGLEI